MSALKPGELVDGRYRVISRLGTGGMADVFLCDDEQLGRQVAVKLLHRRFAEDPGFVERFRREAQSAASLQHPNVVSVFDRGAFDGTYYIAMEYLEGRTLKALIREEAPLDPLLAIDITVQILKATRFAHRRGVIHRDLKPQNVIVDDQHHVKVTDFGIARAGASDMTETGSIMGTAQYLSPEQAQGLAVAESSDLYSIGVVLYEMLTGRLPFDAESAVTIALKHVSEAPVAPSNLNPAIPPVLEQTVLWALNKNPADRPTDADQFIDVLEGVREQISSGKAAQPTASMRAVTAAEAAAALAAAGAEGPHPRIKLGERAPGSDTAIFSPTALTAAAAPVLPDQSGAGGAGAERDGHSGDGGGAWRWLVVLLLLLALGGGVAAFILTRPVKSTVPYLFNLSVSQAEALLNRDDFIPNVINQPSKTQAGIVIAQNPDDGVSRDQGSVVTLFVSSGPGATDVPPVVQLSRKAAVSAIKHSGLTISQILSQSSTTVPKGDATSTDPPAGTQLQAGQAVILYVSSGPTKQQVPGVVGLTQTEATQQLNPPFKVSVVQQASTQPQGTVLRQSPGANSNLASGSTVTLYVSTGHPPMVTVPPEGGKTKAAATAALQSLGFIVDVVYAVTTDKHDVGRVLTESPTRGTSVPKGSTVTLTVGQSPGGTTTTSTTTTGTSTLPGV